MVKRNIDIVFCIDGTGSMTPCIDTIKEKVSNFYETLSHELRDCSTEIDVLRAKVIVFRDYESDGNDAMVISPFYVLPENVAEFKDYVSNIHATGGGDMDENGLEALYYAMKSDFTTGIKDRQIIILFSDADALKLQNRSRYENYPKDMCKDLEELYNIWELCGDYDKNISLRYHTSRLIMFAPENTIYSDISRNFPRSLYCKANLNEGLSDIDFKDIIKIIFASVCMHV